VIRTGRRRAARPRKRAAVVASLVIALSAAGGAGVPAAEASSCIPLLMQCGTGTPAPSPTPAPAPAPGIPLPGGVGAVPGISPIPTAAPVAAVADPNAPTLTLPAAQLGGSSISISGFHSISAVTVPLANGTRAPVLRLVADEVAVDDFLLDVRKATGPSLVTNATRMVLRGNVIVYLDSITATLGDGTAVTFGAATPPPGNELPQTLLRANLGLVGVTAASITFTAPHQSLKG
jgi:hypothetical protein